MENANEKLPQKVEMMFRAVIDMINEGSDINSMKVQDITTRAGIGKGTAYEYFSSKEELIGEAIDWNMGSQIEELRKAVNEKHTFHDKILLLLDGIEWKIKKQRHMLQMISASSESCCVSPALKEHMRKSRFPSIIEAFMKEVMEDGIKEGVLNPKGSEYNLRTSLFSQLMVFAMFVGNADSERSEQINMVKEQVYQNLLLLNR